MRGKNPEPHFGDKQAVRGVAGWVPLSCPNQDRARVVKIMINAGTDCKLCRRDVKKGAVG
jgi:hypothetical protein